VTREEHNANHGANRQASDPVYCHTLGYGELSQYDPDCASCWLGHRHTWEKHDRSILGAREERARRRLIEAACEAEERFDLDELERFAESRRRVPR